MLYHGQHSSTNMVPQHHPAILAFNLMNEPSLTDPNFDSSRQLPRGTTLRTWVHEMAHWIRQYGIKQLLLIGDVRDTLCLVSCTHHHACNTGWRACRCPSRNPQQLVQHRYVGSLCWLIQHMHVHSSGYHGGDARSYVCDGPDSQRGDAATIHYYAESFGALNPASSGGLPKENATWWGSYVIGDRCKMARACGRTCVIQEVC